MSVIKKIVKQTIDSIGYDLVKKSPAEAEAEAEARVIFQISTAISSISFVSSSPIR